MNRFPFTVALLLMSATAYAQAPGSTGPTPSAPAPTAVPLDGGASLLLAGGLGLGLRKLRKLHKGKP